MQVLVWAGLIFFLSSLSNPPGQTGAEWPSNVAHTTEYAVLAFLLVRYLRVAWPARGAALACLAAWLLAVAYGASDEFHQSFVPNRDASPFDWGFDSLGAALGLAAWLMLQRGTASRRG